MKRKALAFFIIAWILGVSGAAFAGSHAAKYRHHHRWQPIAQTKTQMQRPPEPKNLPNGQRPPEPPSMSRDIKGRPEPPKDGKRPPMSNDRRPPKPRSGDRMQPDFNNNGQRPEMPQFRN